MAALGKIRSKGLILICVIGFALFAFIAEEFVRSSDSIRNQNRQQVGEVLGEKMDVQQFQAVEAVVSIAQCNNRVKDRHSAKAAIAVLNRKHRLYWIIIWIIIGAILRRLSDTFGGAARKPRQRHEDAEKYNEP